MHRRCAPQGEGPSLWLCSLQLLLLLLQSLLLVVLLLLLLRLLRHQLTQPGEGWARWHA